MLLGADFGGPEWKAIHVSVHWVTSWLAGITDLHRGRLQFCVASGNPGIPRKPLRMVCERNHSSGDGGYLSVPNSSRLDEESRQRGRDLDPSFLQLHAVVSCVVLSVRSRFACSSLHLVSKCLPHWGAQD